MDLGSLVIPTSLRLVSPFLEEAQGRLLSSKVDKIFLYCVSHALDLVRKFRLRLDDDAKALLLKFLVKRNEVAVALQLPLLPDSVLETTEDVQTKTPLRGMMLSLTPPQDLLTADDILIGEATTTLELADEEYSEGDVEAAAKNYHTATVYFRVLESMVPRLAPKVCVPV